MIPGREDRKYLLSKNEGNRTLKKEERNQNLHQKQGKETKGNVGVREFMFVKVQDERRPPPPPPPLTQSRRKD